MFEILTSDETRKADQLAIASGIEGIRLMQAAGASVAELIKERYKPTAVLVLCGRGNNGGDGFIAAQQLQKSGWAVRVACTDKKTALKNDAALAAKEWVGAVEDLNSNLALKDAGLVIDAVFGTGFTGALPPELCTLFDKIRSKKIPVVAIDLPSGLDGTTGNVADGTLNAAMTVTFSRKKHGHVLLPGKTYCGKVCVADIGVTDKVISDIKTNVFENDIGVWLKSFPIPKADGHKYDRGHVTVYGGAKRTGAACLAAAAAQKSGSGLVSILSPPEAANIYRQYKASLMVDDWNSHEDLKNLLRDERRNVVVLGPGAGTTPDVKTALDTILTFNRRFVIDADAFTLYKSDPQSLFSRLSPECVMTPHMGEFERLFPNLTGNKIEKTQKAAKTSNAIVVLKGSDTIIAAPDGATIVHSHAPATLATAGSGDVLAGLIAGLMAQGMPSFMAAGAAGWLHAETARNYGFCLTPEDIINNLNQTLKSLFGIGH